MSMVRHLRVSNINYRLMSHVCEEYVSISGRTCVEFQFKLPSKFSLGDIFGIFHIKHDGVDYTTKYLLGDK